jgi:hypothetical protein
MGFPQEFRTVRFNLEPKRCKSVSLSAKRSVFTLVGLAHGVVTEKLLFRKIPSSPGGGHGKPLSFTFRNRNRLPPAAGGTPQTPTD